MSRNPLTDRARLGRAALEAYRSAKGESMAQAHRDDRQSEISDCVADLLHLAAKQGFDLGAIVRCAESNVGAERANVARAVREGMDLNTAFRA